MGGRGQVRVAHAQVDDVLVSPPHLHFQLVDGGEDVWGEALHTRELFHALDSF